MGIRYPIRELTALLLGYTVPGPPGEVSGLTVGPNSLQFSWRPPILPNGPILEYRVSVALDFSYNPDRSKFSEKGLRISNTTTSATVIGTWIRGIVRNRNRPFRTKITVLRKK